MAAPHVSGAIALLYSVKSDLTPLQVESMLANGSLTDDIGDAGRDDLYGYGALNLSKSVENIINEVGIDVTYAQTSVSVLDYGFSETVLSVVLSKVGTGDISVSSIGADSATGLTYGTVDSSGASTIDSSGFGTYYFTVDRESLPSGNYQNTAYFQMSDGTNPSVRLNYSVGGEREKPNLGQIYIGMYTAGTDTLYAAGWLSLDGTLTFNANNVSPGNYYYRFSTDIDLDGYICQIGEFCTLYPATDASVSYFTVGDEDLIGDTVVLNPLKAQSGFSIQSKLSNDNDLLEGPIYILEDANVGNIR